jgi:hypothetical protein
MEGYKMDLFIVVENKVLGYKSCMKCLLATNLKIPKALFVKCKLSNAKLCKEIFIQFS